MIQDQRARICTLFEISLGTTNIHVFRLYQTWKRKSTEKLYTFPLKTHPRSCRAHFKFYSISQRWVIWSHRIITNTGKYSPIQEGCTHLNFLIRKREKSWFWWTTLQKIINFHQVVSVNNHPYSFEYLS